MLQPLLIALQFLTRVPVRFAQAPASADVQASLLWYPVVGALLGAALQVLALSIADSQLHLLTAVLIVGVWAAITGGLHLDGLADCVDAWMGGRGERERTLQLMKDPHCGAMAVTALNLLLLTKVTAVAGLVATHDVEVLIAACMLGRLGAVLLFATTPYVRPAGLGQDLAQPSKGAVLVVTLASFVLLAALLGRQALWLSGSALLLGAWLRHLACQRLGGITGDVVGAAIELIEAAVLITGALMS